MRPGGWGLTAARSLIWIVAAVVTATVVAVVAGPAWASPSLSTAAALPTRHRDLPGDAPPALYQRQPTLPPARGWPAGNRAFPATSGTGRLARGALFWTDYLYDDHGATTSSTGDTSVTAGSPSFGTYTYPAGPARNNGADIFRAAVALRRHATVWRVDWNTLVRPGVPLAEWTFDRDGKASTGGSAWPGGAGVSSSGIDTALMVSARRAELINVGSGRVLHRLPVRVSRPAHSFVVRIPRRVLHPTGRWRIRLAAGLADAAGTGFARPPDASAAQPAVYNVAFRHRGQETPTNNFWNDMAQTQALDGSTVAPFSIRVRWRDLARRKRTPQAHPSGWSDRWYVSSVAPGQGVLTSGASISDGKPNYLGRVQPYAVYVPRGYRPGHPAPLTFLLHSLTQNHNQYAATTPHFTRQACEQRRSICVTTLGRGPDGNYFDTAELDFWQVWHAVAAAYDVDPDRTVLSGYSMGGIGTNQLAMAHPDLFARAVTLAGGVGDVPALRNLRWVPTYLAGGGADELVPVTTERAEADRLAALGDRFRWLVIPGIDHVAYELADSFADAARYMRPDRRVVNPGHFNFRWTPANTEQTFGKRGAGGGGLSWTQRPSLGVGTTGDYWLRDLRARSHRRDAWLSANSGERPARTISPRLTRSVDREFDPEPGVVTTQTWRRGGPTARRPVVTLRLHNVKAVRLLPRGAGFGPGLSGRLRVTTDGPVTLRIGHRHWHFGKGHRSLPFSG